MQKTRTDRARDSFLLLLTFAFIYTVVAGLNYDINYWESKCYESAYVTEIHKARHRTVWVTLSNGEELEINQPKPAVFPGSEFCVDSRYERNDTPLSWWMMPVKIFE